MFLRLFSRAPRTIIDLPLPGRRVLGHVDAQPTGEIRAGQAVFDFHHFFGRACGDDVAAVFARAGPQVDQPIGDAHGLFVMLDHQQRIAEVAQSHQRVDQPGVVALVQADRRLVQHVEDAGQLAADLRRQPDALRFAAAERSGRARQMSDSPGRRC